MLQSGVLLQETSETIARQRHDDDGELVKPTVDSREGTASMLVLLDPAGIVLKKTPVTVGG